MLLTGFTCKQDRLIIHLEGEIDHCAALDLRNQIEDMIRRIKPFYLTFDFSEVSFMDSSGVGMIIGRYKTMLSRNGKVNAYGLNRSVERLFRMAGLHRIIPIEETKEEMNA